MVVRLVSLKVDKERIDEFLKYFEGIYNHIRSQPGCHYLQLVRDLEGLGEYLTISAWESLEALDAYRNGAFFRETWPKVKTFLRERAWAQSFEILLDSDQPKVIDYQPALAANREGF